MRPTADPVRETGADGPVVTGTAGDLLGWISGRPSGAALTVSGADEVPAAPYRI